MPPTSSRASAGKRPTTQRRMLRSTWKVPAGDLRRIFGAAAMTSGPSKGKTATADHQAKGHFKSILPEDIEWQQFPAFPPSARLAVVYRSALRARSLCDQGQGACRREADAAQASGGQDLQGHVGRLLHRARREVRRRQDEGVPAGQRHRSARKNAALPLGEIRRVRHADMGHRSAGTRIPGSRRRSACKRNDKR